MNNAKTNAAKTEYVRELFRRINGGDCVDSAELAEELLLRFLEASRRVVDSWERGDLVDAVNALREVLDEAEGR